MNMSYIVTITSQGQMSIPAPLRRKFGLYKTRKAHVDVAGDTIVVQPERDILEFGGIFKTDKKISFKKTRTSFEGALSRGDA